MISVPKYGDIITVWNLHIGMAQSCIYVGFIQGATYPYVVVAPGFEDNFHKGLKFATTSFAFYSIIDPIIEVSIKEIAEWKNTTIDKIKII